jgi:acetyltransferase-like isoleucine patch superfamily enzyme
MNLRKLLLTLSDTIPFVRVIRQTRGTAGPVSIRTWFIQKVIGINRQAYWPMHFSSFAGNVANIRIGVGTAPGLSSGCYIQGIGKLEIGDYTIIAPNVGIITANHDLYDYTVHQSSFVKIGKYCWIGMNAVILPGVTLGDHTVVAAGSVVTKSFVEGYCVIAGNPAKLMKTLDPEKCIEHRNQYEYVGYIPAKKFESFRREHLLI